MAYNNYIMAYTTYSAKPQTISSIYFLHMKRMDQGSSCRRGDAEFIHTFAMEMKSLQHLIFVFRASFEKKGVQAVTCLS